VYCYRSCVCNGRAGGRAGAHCLCLGLLPRYLEIAFIDFHQTGSVGEGADRIKLIKFWRPCAPGNVSAAGRKYLAPRYNVQRIVFASLRALFPFTLWCFQKLTNLDLNTLTVLGRLFQVFTIIDENENFLVPQFP